MELLQVIYYVVASFVLFLILNKAKKLEDKTPNIMIFIPVIYIIFISCLSFINREYIYLVILLEMIFRIYYTKIVLNQEELINQNYYIQNYGIALVLSFVITKYFLISVDQVFPKPEELRMGIWFLIVLFLYKTLNSTVSINLEKQEALNFKMKEEAIVVRYARLKSKYYSLMKKEKDFTLLIYAIMIFENYHRSKFLRSIDRIVYRFTGKLTKMGIMQVESKKEITDEESIKIVIKDLTKLEKEIAENKKVKKQNINQELLKQYFEDENKVNDILSIYNTLKDFDNK